MTVERIDRTFAALRQAKKTALVVYLTVGEPSLADTVACARAALDAGADLLELGVPFSDPTADGPVIAAASYRAIRQGGSLKTALGCAREIRSASDAPLVIFTYYNPIVAFGEATLPGAVAEAGADALLIVDLPPDEGSAVRRAADEAGIAIVPLVAPTTGREREPAIFERAKGFVYYVSVTGVTGTKSAPLAEAGREAAGLRSRAGLPVVVGFGVRTPDDARALSASGVDGIVVGTEVVRVIGEATDTPARALAVRELVSGLRRGLDSA